MAKRRRRSTEETPAGSDDTQTLSIEPTPDTIRERAYQRYLDRGSSDGADFDDWIEAERELRNEVTRNRMRRG